ncbi:MAG: protoporphyrinogen oxidase, partial [Acidobacteria bacterium]|nr:protoporphyrinogen oxidase [Acidobacteriota bacterium]
DPQPGDGVRRLPAPRRRQRRATPLFTHGLMPAQQPYDLVVIGGGPAGLSHAFWQLRERPDLRLLVLEAAPRVGGWVNTVHVDGFQLELGPQGFRPDESIHAFLDATRLTPHVVPCSDSAKRRFVVRGGRAHELPSGPGSLLGSKLLSLAGKLRLLWEPRVRSRSPDGESVAAFVARRFGRQAAPLAEAMMHGIYAGDAHALEIASTMPLATELEREHGSVLRGMAKRRRQRDTAPAPAVCTFTRGMQQSVDELAVRVGPRVRTDAVVTGITRAGGTFEVAVAGSQELLRAREVCVTAPPGPSARMLRALDPTLADELAAIPTVNVASTYLGYAPGAVPDSVDGFGALAPQGEAGSVLGVIFSSRVFPRQAPDGHVLFRVMSGGFAHPAEVDRDDDALAAQAVDVMQRWFGVTAAPILRHVSRARAAIPQYVRGHAARLASIAQRVERHDGLQLRGASYRKVSVVGQWTQEGSRP